MLELWIMLISVFLAASLGATAIGMIAIAAHDSWLSRQLIARRLEQSRRG